MELVTGYATFKDADEADKICSELVEMNLIACANIFSPHKAIYSWNDKIKKTSEVAVIFKTKSELVVDVIDFIKAEHSYDVPGVVTWAIQDGHDEFLSWIESQTV